MPCRCDHMEPSAREVESLRVVKHLQYLLPLAGQLVPPDVAAAADGSMYGNVDLLDQHTALLCETMRQWGGMIQTRLSKGLSKDLTLWLWWQAHQSADEARAVKEREAADEEREHDLTELGRLLKKYPGYGSMKFWEDNREREDARTDNNPEDKDA